MCLTILDKLMNIKIRAGKGTREYFLKRETDGEELEDASKTISGSIWKNVLVKGLTVEYENIKLFACRDSDFTLEQIQDVAHKYYMDISMVKKRQQQIHPKTTKMSEVTAAMMLIYINQIGPIFSSAIGKIRIVSKFTDHYTR